MKKKFAIITSIILTFGFSVKADSQWVQTNGPYGGDIWSLSFSGTHIFAGTGLGLYQSSDEGQNWIFVDSLLIYTRVLASNDSNIIFTIDANNNYRSTDSGKTWQEFFFPLRFGSITSICFLGKLVLAGTDVGIFASSDLGKTWLARDTILLHEGIANLQSENSYVYVSNNNGDVFFSGDSAKHWKKIFIGNNVLYGTKFVAEDDTLLVYEKGFGGSFFISNDDGNSWTITDSSHTNLDVSQLFIHNGNYFALTWGQGILISSDHGYTWNKSDSGLVNQNITCMIASGNKIYAGTSSPSGYETANGLVESTDNGLSWYNPLNKGFYPPIVSCFDTLNNFLLAGTSSGIFLTHDYGETWKPIILGVADIGVNSIMHLNSLLFIGTQSGIYRSDDSGINWKRYSNGLVNDTTITSLAVIKNSIFASGDYLYRSLDSGKTWEQITNADRNYPNLMPIDSILFVTYNSKNGLFRSTNLGYSWTEVNSNMKLITKFNRMLYAYSGKQLLRSSDTGVTWNVVSNSANCPYMSDLKTDGSNFYCCWSNAKGIYASMDSGQTWRDIGSNLWGADLLYITKEFIYATLRGTGVWRRPLSDFGKSLVSQFQISNFSISSFPNPFSQSTNIKFSTHDHSFAQVTIHNLLASDVAQLFSGELDAGEHSFTWDAHNMPAGMYMCLVKTGGEVKEIPLLLVK